MMKRKTIPPKKRLQVLNRDNYTCKMCGKSPALYPGLEIDAVIKLEIDHVRPHSKSGTDDIDNLQTLCIQCNRGKGNNEEFDLTIHEKIDHLLNTINPLILQELNKYCAVKVVANDADFTELQRLGDLFSAYDMQVLNNSIFGYQAMYSAGIYTLRDNHAGKVNFILRNKMKA